MKVFTHNIFRTITAVTLLIAGCALAGANSWRLHSLIQSKDQFIEANENKNDIYKLYQREEDWNSIDSNSEKEQWVTIDLLQNYTLSDFDDDDLVFFIRRTGGDVSHPTILKIEVSDKPNTDWVTLAHAYFVYRGNSTSEYSARINPNLCKDTDFINKFGSTSETNGFRYVRFTVTANNSRSRNAGGYRTAKIGEFDILKLGKTENYSITQIDRFHLVDDYIYDYKDYSVTPTMGMIDDINRHPWFKGYNANGQWPLDANYWNPNTAENPEAQKPHFGMPNFRFLVDADTQQPAANEQPDPDKLIKFGKRQNTHITVHDLYAVRGDAVALYPFYSLYDNNNYMENFSHWYDYETGGGCEYLDFLIDPAMVMPINISANNGKNEFIAGNDIPNDFIIDNEAKYNAFAARVNNGEETLSAIITSDITFTGDIPMIGTSVHPYRGSFNGSGKKLNNIIIDKYEEENVGLFGVVGPGAIITGIVLPNAQITGKKNVGVIGSIQGTTDKNTTPVYISSCYGWHTITATGTHAGGIVGAVLSDDMPVMIENCSILGKVSGESNSALIAGYLGKNNESFIRNIYVKIGEDGLKGCDQGNTIAKQETEQQIIDNIYTNITEITTDGITYQCQGLPYPTKKDNNGNTITDGGVILVKFGKMWRYNNNEDYAYIEPLKTFQSARRKYGTVATFFAPRDPYSERGQLQPLDKEYVIAADYSQTFFPNKIKPVNGDTKECGSNIDKDNLKIIEPIINFRHVFRIHDGKKFADENMATMEANRNYVKTNRRIVSARAGEPFQIRFDSPVPVENTTRSKWYYKAKADGTDYRRICSMDIRVFDADTNEEYSSNLFYPAESFEGQGKRWIDGVEYKACGGGGHYWRMLACKSDVAQAGKRYIVRLIAKDINGNRIYFPDSESKEKKTDDDEVWVQEYLITFYNDDRASLLTEAELYNTPKYANQIPENLDNLHGEPKDVVNYDQYLDLKNTAEDKVLYFETSYFDATGSSYFRWPMPATEVDYAFGYNNRYDYNEYMIVDDGRATSHHSGLDGELRDRLSHDTNGEKNGFFFYVNAAADPGKMAFLKLENFCSGSTIHVSAWLTELSGSSESANLAFNFEAVMKDGARIPIHTFVSGYVDSNSFTNLPSNKNKRGKWYHIYYSFNPDLSTIKDLTMVDHYEIVLENNAKNSSGADYGIDDIRVYSSHPMVYAEQIWPACNTADNNSSASPVKTYISFNTLMLSLDTNVNDNGIATAAEEDKTGKIYYCLLDKKIFDSKYDIFNKTGDYEEAFKISRLRLHTDDNSTKYYGEVTFNYDFEKNPVYEAPSISDIDNKLTVAYKDYDIDQQLLAFNARPASDQLQIAGDYYVALYCPLDESAPTPSYNDNDDDSKAEEAVKLAARLFKVNDPCAQYGVYTITPASEIIIDGHVVADNEQVEYCENQTPVVQVKLMYPDRPYDEFTPFDWYSGTLTQLNGEKYNDATTLQEVLLKYREEYPELNDISLAEPKGILDQNMIAYLKAKVDKGKLRLGGHSYSFPPLKVEKTEEGADIPDKNEEHYATVTAIPVTVLLNDAQVCTDPSEVKIKILNKAPKMLHGLTGIPYPDKLIDVPLRIGLKQLARTEGKKNAKSDHSLIMPVRYINPVSVNVRAMTRMLDEKNNYVYLVETDDPEYNDIRGGYQDALLEAGEIYKMEAEMRDGSSLTGLSSNTTATSKLTIGFFDSFNFKEGYTYRFRYNYKEKTDSDVMTADDTEEEEEKVCDGQSTFTIKVVPEYQKWTGAAGNDDWNNDLNWARVETGDVLFDSKLNKYEHTTDGKQYDYSENAWNASKRSFVPMNFTKTLVKAPAKNSEGNWIYTKDRSDIVTRETDSPEGESTSIAVLETTAQEIVTETANIPELHSLKETEEEVNLGYDNNAFDQNEFKNKYTWTKMPGEKATAGIQWDMVSLDGPEVKGTDGKVSRNVYCRPWLANECEQIHFDAGSWISGQQWLRYDKAWVDFEVAPTRWYTLSSPLARTYAGDMYMPMDGARQLTEKFKDIKYDAKKNNRFKPAVFQRSWNTASVNIYELSGGNNPVKEDVAETQWSKVYNDVQVAYGAGAGFSIMTDVSGMNNGIAVEKALIRLPKADTEYQYFQSDNFGGSSSNGQRVTKDSHHRLNGDDDDATVTVTVTAANDGEYFLVGNPYMNYLDMAEFLGGNNSIESSYWILTDEKQGAAVYLPSEATFISTIDKPGIVAPMQGFFVKAKTKLEGNATLQIFFNAGMMAKKDQITSDPKLGTRASETEATGLRISVAGNDGEAGSSALLAVKAGTSAEYDPAEDARMLVDPTFMNAPQVYTVAGNVAATVNMTPEAAGTRIGLTNADDMTVTLRFDNVDAVDDGMMLYDSQLDSYTPLEEGMEYEVEGEKRGRLFLVKSKGASIEGDITISADGGEVTVVSPTAGGNLTVRVYDTDGRMLRHIADGGQTVRFAVGKGIMIVEANDGSASKTAKLIIR